MNYSVLKKINELEMFKECPCGSLDNSNWLEERMVNIPSSVRL
jgi:perosamine synthetase